VEDQLPGSVKTGGRRLRLPELHVEGTIQVFDFSFAFSETTSHFISSGSFRLSDVNVLSL